jgi:hypothetical protein
VFEEMSKVIFKGVLKPTTFWVGTMFQPETGKDRFGVVREGNARVMFVNTKWGQLQVPTYREMYKYGNKKVKIVIGVVGK